MIRKSIIGLIILIVIIIASSLVGQISDSLRSQDRLSEQAETVSRLEMENRELKKKLIDIQSPEFIEEQARNKLGLSKGGETIVIIPDSKLKSILYASESAKEVRLPNWQGWFKLFF
ncbi:hypothetical protein A3C59_03765 [Candidatus Daviesbacteria bacterium RIFCSPHIGHO2_02_FULL_36_13]|uniref:Cell division protein FtsL n=1 Tax=Candidatus Daviesbacteria bacterium RIFCSPHIGHO2_02_FULL_36_13 TaxID=1797768 RepID=A0A1F5JVL6_9BACT|nr:MAG: hypothetical protein A3C59_03765 [Candidatus Daviesbacteria bacterium RIFCSPHIGHO2_02_FULL_36_13]OGE41517.1 MAG: hypothetical protein A3A45_00765 [Candidatus Daviesbacteria bacterium RIFCSPLOWO2_01_FULL_36_8]